MKRDVLNSSFYKIMAENFGDEIFVTDGNGVILFVNLEACKVIEKSPVDLVGQYIGDLVDKGFFYPSVSLEVIKQRQTVHIIQTLQDGKRVLCTGVPVFDNLHEEIQMVISTTKNLDQINDIYDTVELQLNEIKNLRNITLEDSGFISGQEDRNGIKQMIVKLAPLDVPVLIQGETGVGKGVAAKAMHKFRYGKSRPMIKINCATIPENLIESELFGYEKGAFTGAERSGKRGKVEMAEGGTLFLDEIGEMPLGLQAKLLDFIQDGTFTRIGGTKVQKVKTRIITATNRNLKEMCDNGEFRQDLYYRINVVPFVIPPLRERPDDLDALIKNYTAECNYKYGVKKRFGDDAIHRLHQYQWPGNIRELEHLVEQIFIFVDNRTISADDVDNALMIANGEERVKANMAGGFYGIDENEIIPLKQAKKQVEKQLVLKAYEVHGSTYKAAKALEVDQSTVAKLLKKYREDQQ